MNTKIYEALTASIQMLKMLLSSSDISLTDSQKIKISALYEDWVPGIHHQGQIYNANGQTWECYADYDNNIYPDIIPNNPAWHTFNKPLHGQTPDTARPFVKPTNSMDIYKQNEYIIWTDGSIRRCISDTSYSPDEYPNSWELYTEYKEEQFENSISSEPEIKLWINPDSTNPYMKNAKVMHNNSLWISIIDNNVWEPGVYGWETIE